jgi:hypothetical protein
MEQISEMEPARKLCILSLTNASTVQMHEGGTIYEVIYMISETTKKMVFEHVDEHLYFVEAGKKVDYTQLFDKHLLQATTSLEHRYVFERALAYLMALEDIDLRIVGINEGGKTLYQRVV